MSAVSRWTSPAVFLDRDGCLIEDVGYVRNPSDVVFFDNTVEALALLAAKFRLFIVTNQSGVAEGVITRAEVDKVHEFILGHLGQFGIHISRVYFCPHKRSDGCRCIKPNPFFLEAAALRYGVDLSRSFVVGDHPHDMELAHNAGARGVYVLTGHGEKDRAALHTPCGIAKDIREAAEMIMQAQEEGPEAGRDS